MTAPAWRNTGPARQDIAPARRGEPASTAGASQAAAPLPLLGGRYLLGAQIGRGAMGVVWRAHDELLCRDIAVKEVRLPPSLSETERDNGYQRTLREARAAARLGHPAVATVYDVVEELGRPWIVLELVPGRSLDQVIAREGPLSPVRAADMGRQLLAALAAAHAAGVLHRDVKPGNVLLSPDGRTVLTDFGIAAADGDPSLTEAGIVLGSPGFLAPERIRGSAATPASDLWALGATLYAAVEGHGPYDRLGGAMTMMAAIVTEDPRPPVAAGPLATVISALLSRDPAARPTATTAARMLEAVLHPAAIPPHAGRSSLTWPPPAPGAAPLARQRAMWPGLAHDTRPIPGYPDGTGHGRLLASPASMPSAGWAAVRSAHSAHSLASAGSAHSAGSARSAGSAGSAGRTYRIITIAIIGAAIFIAAALAAARINGANPGISPGRSQPHPASPLPGYLRRRPGLQPHNQPSCAFVGLKFACRGNVPVPN